MSFAEKTNVPISKTKGEIDGLLRKHKATGFGTFEEIGKAIVVFEMAGRRIRFDLPLPSETERRFTHHSKGMRSRESALKEWEQGCRSRWRALFLCIKAKLESIESRIETFDDAFLAHILLPNGDKVGDVVKPNVEQSYLTQKMQPLLPAPRAREE
jgi:hypothetical protein